MAGLHSEWTILEKLLLTQSVYKHGENSWFQVARILKQHCLLQGRPSDFFSQKNCSFQYYLLVENLEAENQLFKNDLKNDMPTVVRLARQLYAQRVDEIKRKLKEDEEEFGQLVLDIDYIRSGSWDEKLAKEALTPLKRTASIELCTKPKRSRINSPDEIKQEPNIDSTTDVSDLTVAEVSDVLRDLGSAETTTKVTENEANTLTAQNEMSMETISEDLVIENTTGNTSKKQEIEEEVTAIHEQQETSQETHEIEEEAKENVKLEEDNESSKKNHKIKEDRQNNIEKEEDDIIGEDKDDIIDEDKDDIIDEDKDDIMEDINDIMEKDINDIIEKDMKEAMVEKKNDVIESESNVTEENESDELEEDMDDESGEDRSDELEEEDMDEEQKDKDERKEYKEDDLEEDENDTIKEEKKDCQELEDKNIEIEEKEENEEDELEEDNKEEFIHNDEDGVAEHKKVEVQDNEGDEINEAEMNNCNEEEHIKEEKDIKEEMIEIVHSDADTKIQDIKQEEADTPYNDCQQETPMDDAVDQQTTVYTTTDSESTPMQLDILENSEFTDKDSVMSDDDGRSVETKSLTNITADVNSTAITHTFSSDDETDMKESSPDQGSVCEELVITESNSPDLDQPMEETDTPQHQPTTPNHNQSSTLIIPEDQSDTSPNIQSPEDEDFIASETATPTNTPEKKKSREDQRQKSWLKNINLLWHEIANHKNGTMFMNPIKKSYAPLYYRVVKQPLDLKSIKYRVRDGVIKTTAEFERDIILMLTNSLMYNKEGTEMYMMAKEMLEDVKEQIRVFKSADSYSVSFWENVD